MAVTAENNQKSRHSIFILQELKVQILLSTLLTSDSDSEGGGSGTCIYLPGYHGEEWGHLFVLFIY